MYCLFLSLLLALTLSNATYAHYTVSPVTVNFQPPQKIASLTVKNESATSKVLHIKIMKWIQKGSEHFYEDTSDWILTPGIMTIAPGKTQLIRLAPRQKLSPKNEEQTYRLFLREVPEPSHKRTSNTIQTLLNISIPVFYRPLTCHTVPPICRAQKQKGHLLKIQCTNQSNVHHLVTQIFIAQGSLEKPLTTFQYILPGQTVTIDKILDKPLVGNEKVRGCVFIEGDSTFVDIPWK